MSTPVSSLATRSTGTPHSNRSLAACLSSAYERTRTADLISLGVRQNGECGFPPRSCRGGLRRAGTAFVAVPVLEQSSPYAVRLFLRMHNISEFRKISSKILKLFREIIDNVARKIP